MAKGFIAIDIPEHCDLCPLGRIFGMNGGVECRVAPEGKCVAGYGLHIEKPDWCPIRPFPEKDRESYVRADSYWQKQGWNQCVNYLEGENDR